MDPTKENGLKSTSILLVFQLVSLDVDRFVHRIGKLSAAEMRPIDTLTKDLLGL